MTGRDAGEVVRGVEMFFKFKFFKHIKIIKNCKKYKFH